MPFSGGATFLCESVPEFEFKDGMFYVTFQVGTEACIRIGLRPHHFLRANRRGAVLVATFDGGNIIEFPEH